jgi:hypothetical protein
MIGEIHFSGVLNNFLLSVDERARKVNNTKPIFWQEVLLVNPTPYLVISYYYYYYYHHFYYFY